MNIRWHWAHFSELTTAELYKILQLRQQVFVLEQQCLYQDIDDMDNDAWHLSAYREEQLIAYLRVVAPGRKYKEPSIGRVITKESYRGIGVGKLLLNEGIQRTYKQFPSADIRISAQMYLAKFYSSAGFKSVGNQYLEDDIPHIEMILQNL